MPSLTATSLLGGIAPLVGVGLLLIARRMNRFDLDRQRSTPLEPIVGDVYDKKISYFEGTTFYELLVGLPDRPDTTIRVDKHIYDTTPLGEVELAVHPRNPKRVLHPELPFPPRAYLFIPGLLLTIFGVVAFVAGFFVVY